MTSTINFSKYQIDETGLKTKNRIIKYEEIDIVYYGKRTVEFDFGMEMRRIFIKIRCKNSKRYMLKEEAYTLQPIFKVPISSLFNKQKRDSEIEKIERENKIALARQSTFIATVIKNILPRQLRELKECIGSGNRFRLCNLSCQGNKVTYNPLLKRKVSFYLNDIVDAFIKNEKVFITINSSNGYKDLNAGLFIKFPNFHLIKSITSSTDIKNYLSEL